MITGAAPPPIPGRIIDPPPKEAPKKVHELDAQSGVVGTGVGVGYRALLRFTHSLAALLAAGTAYYLFFAMFSIIALAYGLVTSLGADNMAAYLTDAIGEAFPGLLGDDGIDAEQLRQIGQATSVVGAIGVLYGGTGAVLAAAKAIHQIYGTPNDPRNFVLARVRALGWLILLGLLAMVSFAMSSLTSDLASTVIEALNLDGQPTLLLDAGSAALTTAVNWVILYLILGHFGGVRPERRWRALGAAVGAVATTIVQQLLGLLIGFTIDKPEYGAAAAPIGMLFVLYLLTLTLYATASLTAGMAEKDRPLAGADHPQGSVGGDTAG
jgi:membrane protein